MDPINEIEQMKREFAEMGPGVVDSIRQMIGSDITPVAAKVQLIGMVLDRVMGKAEVPVKVTSCQENMESAEEKLMILVQEMQEEGEGVKYERRKTAGGPGDTDAEPGDDRAGGRV